MQLWPQHLRRCLRQLGPLRPVPPSFALSAGIRCLRVLRFLYLRHNAVPLWCLLVQRRSSLTWPCPGRSRGVEAALPLLLLLFQLLPVPSVTASSVVSAPPRPHDSIVVSALGGGGGVSSFFRTFGFPEVGAITLPDPVRRLSVPPLAGLEGQRCRSLGGGGVAVRIPHSFPLQPSSNQGSHLAFLPPFIHQRGGSGGGYSGPCGQECGGACSSAFPGLLQSAFRSVEDLRVLETRHRSLDPQSLRGCVALPHRDHPVCPLCSSGRLDGLHRPPGSLPAGSCPSGLSALPSVCGSEQCLPVLCPLLQPLHGSTGLHGSWLLFPPFSILGVSA